MIKFEKSHITTEDPETQIKQLKESLDQTIEKLNMLVDYINQLERKINGGK